VLSPSSIPPRPSSHCAFIPEEKISARVKKNMIISIFSQYLYSFSLTLVLFVGWWFKPRPDHSTTGKDPVPIA
jgi:hypothetical protein